MKSYMEQAMENGAAIDDIVPIDYSSHAELLEKLKNEPITPTMPSGISGLDEIIDGFDPGRLYVLSHRR
jgi:replicative DNA helicase